MKLADWNKKPRKLRPGKYKCPNCDAFVGIYDNYKRFDDIWFKKHQRYTTWCKRCGWEWHAENYKKDIPVLRLLTPWYDWQYGIFEYGLSDGHATILGCNMLGAVKFRWQGRLLRNGYIELGDDRLYVEVN